MRKLVFFVLLFIGAVAYANGDFQRIGEFFKEFRPKTPIMATSELRSDATRIKLLGLEIQGKDELDSERYMLETARMFQESGYAAHTLGILCTTDSGKRVYGGTENCLSLTSQNAPQRFLDARQAEKNALAAAECHRKKGVPLTPWSKSKRREACAQKVINRLWQ